MIRFRPGGTTPLKVPAVCAINGKSGAFIKIEVPFGKSFGSTRQTPFAAVIVLGHASVGQTAEIPEPASIIREPVTGGNRSVDTDEKGIVSFGRAGERWSSTSSVVRRRL